MSLLIFFFVLSISVSFLCSLLEAGILSISPSYIAGLEDKNPTLYKRISAYKEHIDRPLAAILTLNTIAHTVGATGVGAQVVELWGNKYMGIASAIMTLAILVLSEIFPKVIGAKYYKKLLPFMCACLRVMVFVLKPFLIMSEFLTSWMKDSGDDASTADEIKALAKIAMEEKALNENDFRIINNVLSLKDIKVKDVMTPRTVVQSVKPTMKIKDFDAMLPNQPFSRFPIVDEDKEEFFGYIHKSSSYQAKDTQTVKSFAQKMVSLYSDAKLDKIFQIMLEGRNPLALVMDQHGNWVGIISLEDILETVLGKEIIDETDTVSDMQLYAKLKWKRKSNTKKKKEE
ncbi:MAG: CNNM domain-containing protein [Alphaproteobacteria bacterium]